MKTAFLGCAGLFILAGTAAGGVVNIGNGWQASWENSLDGFVDLFASNDLGDTLILEKSAEFTSFPQNVAITFTQIAADAESTFGIDDEIITNSTGTDWTDFHMSVVGADAVFDPTMTANSGGGGPIGFTISPFTNASFANGDTEFNIDGGVVPDGTQWFPGSGANDGILFFNVTPGDGQTSPFVEFVLNEYPTPTPGTTALAAIALTLVSGRRRRD